MPFKTGTITRLTGLSHFVTYSFSWDIFPLPLHSLLKCKLPYFQNTLKSNPTPKTSFLQYWKTGDSVQGVQTTAHFLIFTDVIFLGLTIPSVRWIPCSYPENYLFTTFKVPLFYSTEKTGISWDAAMLTNNVLFSLCSPISLSVCCPLILSF